jgi:hypothetical protein
MDLENQQTNGSFPTVHRMALDAWTALRVRLSTIIALGAIGVVVFALARWLGAGTLSVGVLLQANDFPNTFPGGLPARAGYYVLIIAYVYLAYAMLVAVTSAELVTVKQALRATVGKIPNLLWISILVGAVVLGGLLLVVIPGLIFIMWFIFATYVYLNQGIGGLSALRVSKEYVRGFFWRLAWCFFAFGICVGLVYLVIIAIFSALALIGGAIGVAFALVSLLASNIISVYGIAYANRVFKALQQRQGIITTAPQATAPLVIGFIGCGLFVIAILLSLIFASDKFDNLGNYQNSNNSSSVTLSLDDAQTIRLNVLKLAIDEFHKDKGGYPVRLQDLSPDYIKENALDLTAYTYTLGTNNTPPQVCAALSSGELSCLTASS